MYRSTPPPYIHYNIYFDDLIMPAPPKGIGLFVHKNKLEEIILPKNYEQPIFLGATKGHTTMYINCNNCDYVGISNKRREYGFTYYLFGIATLGIGFCTRLGRDTHHYCPSCLSYLAYSKLF